MYVHPIPPFLLLLPSQHHRTGPNLSSLSLSHSPNLFSEPTRETKERQRSIFYFAICTSLDEKPEFSVITVGADSRRAGLGCTYTPQHEESQEQDRTNALLSFYLTSAGNTCTRIYLLSFHASISLSFVYLPLQSIYL